VEGGEFGGSALSDWDVYRLRSKQGGLGYTPEKLKVIFSDFDVQEIRRMREMGEKEGVFGHADLLRDFLRLFPIAATNENESRGIFKVQRYCYVL
jgi:hypothetical protein